jgi:uncharacterized protein involved in response to NO
VSCGPVSQTERVLPSRLLPSLADEGFRLFFVLGALYAAFWPSLWILAFGFDLPLATHVPPSLWHAHEMLVGAFGAALIGFLTTAIPEWTDTEPPRGRPLWALAILWGVGRVIGIFGWDGFSVLGVAADLAWMLALFAYVSRVSWERRTDRLLAFAFWLALLIACVGTARWNFLAGDLALASKALHLAGMAYLGLLGLALARITVPVTNLILDPSEETSPFRPHPGRMNLAPGLVLVAMGGDIAGLSPAVSGFLLIAAGAAFMDRLAEHFIWQAFARAEVQLLGGASACAGAGLMMSGAARLGAPWAEVTGLHVAFMGGLGLGVYAVYCIAGLLHSGRTLGLPALAKAGAVLLVVSVGARIAPDLGIPIPGPLHVAASLGWSGAFVLWLIAFWPAVRTVTIETRSNHVPAAENSRDEGLVQETEARRA